MLLSIIIKLLAWLGIYVMFVCLYGPNRLQNYSIKSNALWHKVALCSLDYLHFLFDVSLIRYWLNCFDLHTTLPRRLDINHTIRSVGLDSQSDSVRCRTTKWSCDDEIKRSVLSAAALSLVPEERRHGYLTQIVCRRTNVGHGVTNSIKLTYISNLC